jgi:hypothetical protein
MLRGAVSSGTAPCCFWAPGLQAPAPQTFRIPRQLPKTFWAAQFGAPGTSTDILTTMRTIPLILFVALLPLHVLAADPPPEAVDALLRAARLPEAVEALAGSAAQYARQATSEAAKGKTLADTQQKALDEVNAHFAAQVRTELTYARVAPTYARFYKEQFSADEIQALTAFFQSPAGTAWLGKTPLIQQKAQEANRSLMLPLMQQLQSDIGKILAKP